MAVTMKNAVSWDVAPCSSCVNRPAHADSSLADFSTLKMEAIRSSETSVHKIYTASHPRRRHSSVSNQDHYTLKLSL
jgi:hypothetical protein